MGNALSVLAVSPRGSMFDPSAVFYMEKLATGPEAADVVDIRLPRRGERPAGRPGQEGVPSDVTVVILDRPRHQGIIDEVRSTGARIKFITDGDVAGAIMAAREGTGIDLLVGIGGTPEGIIAACAIKTLGGVIQGGSWPKDDDERQKAVDAGHDLSGCWSPTSWSRARTSSSSRPASPTASCCAVSATAAAGSWAPSIVMRSAADDAGDPQRAPTARKPPPDHALCPSDMSAHDPTALPASRRSRWTTARPTTSPAWRLPSVPPPATDGSTVDLVARPGAPSSTPTRAPASRRDPLVADWDEIPGARGCTPESCGFRDHHAGLAAVEASVLGLSTQDTAYQREAVDRLRLPSRCSPTPRWP